VNDGLYPQFKILLVDDEISFLRSMSLTLERQGYTNLLTCDNPLHVKQLIATNHIGLILLDLTMPVLSGQDLLNWVKEEYPDIAVIIFSGLNQVDAAVDCVKKGAFDYIVKTANQEQIFESIKRAIRNQELSLENQSLRAQLMSTQLNKPECFSNIVTANKQMMSIFYYLESVAQSNQPLLITGESGVGKELIAEATHALSSRQGDLVSVNVAGLDDNIFADTLFGHARGAFTGADKQRLGLVEQAAGGTLFLDEIGDLSLSSQVKLLRLLQEGEYYPIGSDRPKRTQARVIVATHQDLTKRQDEGVFRKDLYYRLHTHRVDIPPLRERPEDISLLIQHFMKKACDEIGKSPLSISKTLASHLTHYAFPGNARELRALVYDSVSQSRGQSLNTKPFETLIEKNSLGLFDENQIQYSDNTPLPTLNQASEILVNEAMVRANQNQSLAARMLGISQPALSKRLKNMKENQKDE
jgi:DNA-binding NtrC family response regulator